MDMMEKRVQAGMGRLDSYFGSSIWVERIDPFALDIESGDLCVLGQLFHKYGEAINLLGINDPGPQRDYQLVIDCGFTIPPLHRPIAAISLECERLTAAWQAAVMNRRIERSRQFLIPKNGYRETEEVSVEESEYAFA